LLFIVVAVNDIVKRVSMRATFLSDRHGNSPECERDTSRRAICANFRAQRGQLALMEAIRELTN